MLSSEKSIKEAERTCVPWPRKKHGETAGKFGNTARSARLLMDIQGKSKEHMRKSERKPSVLMIVQKNLEENHQILPANITFAACSRKTI